MSRFSNLSALNLNSGIRVAGRFDNDRKNDLVGSGGVCLGGVVAQIWSQPFLRLVEADPLAFGIRLDLVTSDLADREILRVRV